MTQTFRKELHPAHILLDERSQIGPHHLAIGKTKKIFSHGVHLFAFYSTGYEIVCSVIDKVSLEIIQSAPLTGISPAWGGGNFCVDFKDETVHLVYTSLDRQTTAYISGFIEGETITWSSPRQAIMSSTPGLAAPWVEAGVDGEVWASTVGRDGNFHIAYSPDGTSWRQTPLFQPGEDLWHHSCVQVLPIGKGEAVAVGFTGTFPVENELVWKHCKSDLTLGPSTSLAPCNVNDQLTFHFQAIGDTVRNRAHIVYLGEGLGVDHAVFEGGKWRVTHQVVEHPSFAPQICMNKAGDLVMLSVDYEGAIWDCPWAEQEGWQVPKRLEETPPVPISPAYGRTGYGSGGMIAATRSEDHTVPYLAGECSLDPAGPTRLHAGVAGHQAHLSFAGPPLAEIADDGSGIAFTLPLQGLAKSHLKEENLCWLAHSACSENQERIAVAISSRDNLPPDVSVLRLSPSGEMAEDLSAKASIEIVYGSIFNGAHERASLIVHVSGDFRSAAIASEGIGETYRNVSSVDRLVISGDLVDHCPFDPEPNSVVARNPHDLPKVFKRLL